MTIELIENYPCKTFIELLLRESHIIKKENPELNSYLMKSKHEE